MNASNESTPAACGRVLSGGNVAPLAPLSPLPAAKRDDGQPQSRPIIVSDRGPRPAANRHAPDVERRDVEPHDAAATLRAMLGLDPEAPAPGELAAGVGRPLPLVVTGLDAGAWIAWCMVGLAMFGGDFPSLAHARSEVKRALTVIAMMRAQGSISEAGRLTGTSRKIIRDNLKGAGLYPWHASELVAKAEVVPCE